MTKGFFVVTASLALVASLGLTSSPAGAGAAGPHGPVAIAVGPSPLVAQSIVQDKIVPGGFFTLPTAGPSVVKDSIVPHGFFSLPTGAHRRPFHRRFPRRFFGAGVVTPGLIVAVPPIGPDD